MNADPTSSDPPLLAAIAVTVSYGGVRAVDAVSLGLDRATLVGLIGPNGAGKTTFIDAICGFVPCSGSVTLDGVRLDGLAPHERARRGLVRTFQQAELFDELDVRGNLLVAAARPTWWRPLADLVRPGRARTPAALERAVDMLGIGHLLDRPTDRLSEGERKLVGLCRALAAEPRVLLLDEPAAGLDTEESQDLGRRLRAIVDTGVTVLLVDHDVDLVLNACDVVHVVDNGGLIASGSPAAVRADERVVHAYLGTGANR